MKEIIDNVIGFIKGLMQPLVTLLALMVAWFLVVNKLVDPKDAWLLVIGVIAFWFGKTAGLFGGGDSSPKANGPIETNNNKLEGWGSCDDTDYDNETVNTGFSPAKNTSAGKVDGIIAGIFSDLKDDGIKPDVAAVSARIVSYLGAHGDELSNADLEELINVGINYAGTAYSEVTGLSPVPATYAEVADYNKWWRNNQKACKANKGEARAVLMTLRDLLRRRDE